MRRGVSNDPKALSVSHPAAQGLFRAAATAALMGLAPLAGAPARLVHPSPWLAVVVVTVLLASHPPISLRRMLEDPVDRWSTLGIFASMTAAQVATIADFGYRPVLSPQPLSALVAVGTSITIGGLWLRLWSIRTLGRFFTASVTVMENQPVIRDGPYRLLRHPSYSGAVSMSLGIAAMHGSALGLVATLVLALPAYLYRVRIEERAMIAKLGAAYREYAASTWRLVPYVL